MNLIQKLVFPLVLAGGLTSAHAESDAAADARQATFAAAARAAESAQVAGPAEVDLLDQGKLHLPEGELWIPKSEAANLLRAMGNTVDERLVGLVLPQGDGNWMVVAKFEKAGYVKDDDARDWKADELLDGLKKGTEASNEDRRTRGFPELLIDGWVQAPKYDSSTHRLVWSIKAHNKGAEAQGASINYNTYALGRDGYFSLNLVTDLGSIDTNKQIAHGLLAALDYRDGKRYADFNASSDKVAEYGLAALVGGLAAKKLGFFALAAGLFAKFFKVIALAGVAVIAGVSRFFKRGKDSEAA